MAQVVIIDYGMGNIESVANALHRLGANCIVSDSPKALEQAEGIILPGVGAFYAAMQNLHERGLIDSLNQQVLECKKPFLGICLGMQLIAGDSVETHYCKGLGWIDANVVKIPSSMHHPVPHVGWNQVQQKTSSTLYTRIESDTHFFFDHSYHMQCDPAFVTGVCQYGNQTLTSSVEKENIFAVQFHPEKSQRHGLKLLRNFLNFLNKE